MGLLNGSIDLKSDLFRSEAQPPTKVFAKAGLDNVIPKLRDATISSSSGWTFIIQL